jgi:two-component system, OmpR family, phosphate regulon sensor histidine kinase PhoR
MKKLLLIINFLVLILSLIIYAFTDLVDLTMLLVLFILGLELIFCLIYKYYGNIFNEKNELEKNEFEKQIRLIKNELDKKNNQLNLISNFTGQGLILIYKNGNLGYLNELAITFLDLVINEDLTYYSKIRDIKIKEQIEKTFKEQKMIKNEYMINHKHLEVKTFPYVLDEDEHVLILIDNLTEKIQLQHMKRDFFSFAGHELKTPITVLKGYAELINSEIVNEDEAKKLSGKMIELTDYMTLFVDDMLMLSRLEVFFDEPLEDVYVKTIILDVIDNLYDLLTSKNIEINLTGDDYLIKADKRDIYKLFRNLIENAIKYNKENGLISINISKHINKTKIEIKDTGKGIPYTEIDRIFERFYRINETRKTPGTGLGLAIVKHIVNKYSGTIQVESKEDLYSIFTVII